MADTATEERLDEAQAGGTERTPERENEAPAVAARETAAAETSGRGAAEPESGAAEQAEELVGSSTDDGPAAHGIEFLSEIELEAAVELGHAHLSIGEVLQLAPGAVVQLDKMLGDPVELVIKERLVARGEVVVVDDRFGLRITEIVPSGSG